MAKAKEIHEEDNDTPIKGTAVATKEQQALAAYTEDAGLGMENVGADEQLVPFFRILQALSPEVEQQTIPGAMAGMIINTATKEIYNGKDTGILFVPAIRQHNYARFIPREQGGGFQGLIDVADKLVDECKARADEQYRAGQREMDGRFGKLPTSEGHELVETFYFYGLFVSPEDVVPAPQRGVLSFSSTQIKVYKAMISTLMRQLVKAPNGKMVPMPPWAHRWQLKTVPVKGKKGNYWGWQAQLLGGGTNTARIGPDNMLYQLGKELYVQYAAGEVKAAYKQDAPVEEDM